VTLEELDEEALMRILTEPKNALVKQYKKLFEMDDVELEVDEDAIRSIAKKAIAKKTGARGLRSIMESIMTDIMYEIPSRDDVSKCILTKAAIEDDVRPTLVMTDQKPELKDQESA